jgi:O-antigen/teichoic acid export membrane protein
MAFYNRFDSVIIERLLRDTIGNEQVGIYASAYRLLDATNMIAYLFSILLLPLFARMIKNNQPIHDLIKLAFTLLFVMAIAVAVSAIFYGHPIMNLLYQQHTTESLADYESRIRQSSMVFSVLMCGFIPISTTYIFGSLLTANGNLKHLNMVAAGGMLLNIVMNIVLVPHFYALGSAITSLTAQTITAVLQVFLALRFFRFKTDYIYLLRLLFFAAGSVLIAALLVQTSLPWIKALSITLVAVLVWSNLLRLLNIRAFIKILKSYDEA